MKKYISKSNLLIGVGSLLLIILFFISHNLSYSSNTVSLHGETVKDRKYSNEEVWDFLSNLNDVNNIGQEGISYFNTPVVIQEENDKEDPELVIKKNEEKKGVAKKSSSKEAKEKYETNETSFGIDVSTWQNNIDWKKVKQSGVNFAMIRAGFRRLDAGDIVMDNKFLDNIKGAIANNINVGVYFFSMARNASEALEEAEWLVNAIKDYDITYPVAIDIEIFDQNRLAGVSYSTMTDNALVFCEYVRKKGYTPMIYSYAKALTNYFNTAKFSNERIWLAQYNDTVTYKGKYHMWQYTSSGSVPGIKTRVDMNVAYFSVTNDVTKASPVNGINNIGNLEKVNFIDMDMKTTLSKDVSLRISPYTNLPNKAGTLPDGTSVIVSGISDYYTRIIYNGDVFYINDTDCFIMNKEKIEFTEKEIAASIKEKVELLKEPYNYLKNNIALELVEGDIIVTGESEKYTRITYAGDVFYVLGKDFYTVKEDNTEEPDELDEPDEPSEPGEEIGDSDVEER